MAQNMNLTFTVNVTLSEEEMDHWNELCKRGEYISLEGTLKGVLTGEMVKRIDGAIIDRNIDISY